MISKNKSNLKKRFVILLPTGSMTSSMAKKKFYSECKDRPIKAFAECCPPFDPVSKTLAMRFQRKKDAALIKLIW
jgi:hypothetical protein